MYRLLILIILVISSCTQYTAVTHSKPDYILILENNITDINLYENNRQVFIGNIGDQLIIELDYNVNLNNIIIYDILPPNDVLYLYTFMETSTKDITITINSVEFY